MSHPDPHYDADEGYPDYGRGLFCPHCHLWIGDPDDPEIAHISIDHDLSECEGTETLMEGP